MAPPANPLHYHPDCPTRVADWRWGLAGRIADGTIPRSRRRDDAWLRHAIRFKNALRRCRNDDDREALIAQMPAIGAAHAIYAGDSIKLRWLLEARVLAGEPAGTIASRLGVGRAVVEAFEAVFFDVREHLDRVDSIVLSVIRFSSGPMPPDPGTILKLFAYHGGPLVLDFLLGTSSGLVQPERPEQNQDFAWEHVRDELLMKLAIAAVTLPVDGRSALKLLDLYLTSLKDARRVSGSGSVLESIRPNVMAMWDGLPSFLTMGPVSPTTETLSAMTPGSNGPGR